MKYVLSLLMFVVLSLVSTAQDFSIKGKVADSTGSPLVGAHVELLKAADSSIVTGKITDKKGIFIFTELNKGKYLLKTTYIGYKDKFKPVEYKGSPITVNDLVLDIDPIMTSTVEVTGNVPMATQQGDTTQFNAKAFRTNPDATAEDLVQKLPGVTVQDGKVQAQGEDVKKVLVDGKPFFGDDPSSVLKNIPAEVIDKVQVFDKKSEQAEFTGFDDGNSSKTMNIMTRSEFRNGLFGKAYAGGGNNEKYKAGGVLNYFNNDQRLTILGQSNNINEQNFSPEDLLGIMSSGGGRRMGFGPPPGVGGGGHGPIGQRPGGGGHGGPSGDPTQFLIDSRKGITTTNAIGFNYSDKFSEQFEFTGSYFFNWSRNNTTSDTYRDYFTVGENSLVYNENSTTNSTNMNHRANFKIDYKIDSMNSINIQPRFTAQPNEGNGTVWGQYATNSLPSNLTDYVNSSDLSAYNISVPVLYRHSFETRGRTISLNVTPGYNSQDGLGTLFSNTTYYSDINTEDTIDQEVNTNRQGYTLNSSVNYTEPLDSNNSLQFRYGNNYSLSQSDKFTNNKSLAGTEYNLMDTLLSSSFESKYMSQEAELSYRYQMSKFNLNAGVSYQWANLVNDRTFPFQYDISRNFGSVLFNAWAMYRISMTDNLRLSYRTNTNAPSITQLQDVVDNSNPLQLTTGNPDLNQTYQHSFNLRYSSVDMQAGSSFFAMFGGTLSNDYIASDVFYSLGDTITYRGVTLQPGSQITSYKNTDGYISLRTFISYGIPVNIFKTNLNFNVMGNYTKAPSYLNGELNYSETPLVSGGIVLSSNISESVDFTLSSFASYSNTVNSLREELNQEYYSQNSRFRLNIILFGQLVFNSELSHNYYTGLSSSYNQNYLLWNAAIAFKFLEKNRAEIRFQAVDLLNQNTAVQFNTTETYYEDYRSNVIPRYFLFTFTYNFNQYGGGGEGRGPGFRGF
jgi:hypothetical protein